MSLTKAIVLWEIIDFLFYKVKHFYHKVRRITLLQVSIDFLNSPIFSKQAATFRCSKFFNQVEQKHKSHMEIKYLKILKLLLSEDNIIISMRNNNQSESFSNTYSCLRKFFTLIIILRINMIKFTKHLKSNTKFVLLSKKDKHPSFLALQIPHWFLPTRQTLSMMK